MTDTPDTAVAEKRGGVGILFAIALTLILAVLLVFPGFLAAFLSRAGCHVYMWEYGGGFYEYPDGYPALLRLVLYPAEKMMEHSTTMDSFYLWQYKLAGGHVILPPWATD